MTIKDLLYTYENYNHLVILFDSIDDRPLTSYVRMSDVPYKFRNSTIASFVTKTSDRSDVIVFYIHINVESSFRKLEEKFKHAKTCNSVL